MFPLIVLSAKSLRKNVNIMLLFTSSCELLASVHALDIRCEFLGLQLTSVVIISKLPVTGAL